MVGPAQPTSRSIQNQNRFSVLKVLTQYSSTDNSTISKPARERKTETISYLEYHTRIPGSNIY